MKGFVGIFILVIAATAFAQSRRVSPANSQDRTATAETTVELTVKQMFDEANAYNKAKFAEFEKKKIAYSENLRLQTEREQKQLAAKYAATASARTGLSGDDLYYLGLLHWIAENLEGAAASLRQYAALETATPEKAQTARSIVVVIAAKKAAIYEAEKLYADYLNKEPKKLTERSRMANEMAKAFMAAKNFAKATPYAEEAYKAAKVLAEDLNSRTRGLDELLDSGMLVFESYREQKLNTQADAALEDMQKVAASVGSSSFFFYATDKLITYQIESGRKTLAMETYLSSLIKAGRDLPLKGQQTDAIDRLKKREKHYKILLEPAPEIVSVDKWFPGEPRTLSSLRGKVVLLDFWATWCIPCFDAFPSFSEWNQDLSGEGLVILGVTRYYGRAEGFPVDNENEIEFLKRFKKKYDLAYDFVVVSDQQTQILYGATALPTAVLIDRKGKIRYIEAGTSPSRLDEMRQMVLKLLAEK